MLSEPYENSMIKLWELTSLWKKNRPVTTLQIDLTGMGSLWSDSRQNSSAKLMILVEDFLAEGVWGEW
jgi:hypothetical protein